VVFYNFRVGLFPNTQFITLLLKFISPFVINSQYPLSISLSTNGRRCTELAKWPMKSRVKTDFEHRLSTLWNWYLKENLTAICFLVHSSALIWLLLIWLQVASVPPCELQHPGASSSRPHTWISFRSWNTRTGQILVKKHGDTIPVRYLGGDFHAARRGRRDDFTWKPNFLILPIILMCNNLPDAWTWETVVAVNAGSLLWRSAAS